MVSSLREKEVIITTIITIKHYIVKQNIFATHLTLEELQISSLDHSLCFLLWLRWQCCSAFACQTSWIFTIDQ